MTIWIFLVIFLVQSVCGQVSFFSGGAMFFKFIDTSSSLYEVEITTVTAWKLREGPCGKTCAAGDVGQSTRQSRSLIISSIGSGVFGFWSREENYVQTDMTNLVESTIQETVTAVNDAQDYEEEVSRVVLTIDPSLDYTDVTFHGNNWRSFDYAYNGPTSYHLQVKITPGRRNDTGQPNNSPVAIAQPMYSIQLNKKSTITLAPTDSDGDLVKCSLGKFISAGGLKVPPKVTVKEDCRIDMEPLASDGYLDGGVGAIPIVISDYNQHVITIEGETVYREAEYSPLSQVLLQFMFKTVANISGPEFLLPTYHSQQLFEVYQGCYFQLSLVANHSDVNWYFSFLVRSAPYLELSAGSVLDLKGGIKHVEVLSPRHVPIGAYAVGAIAFDGKGSSERNYKLQVKPLISLVKMSKREQSRAPYMIYVPKDAYVCQLRSLCTFPVFTKKGVTIYVVNSTFSSVQLGYKVTEVIDFETVEETDVTVASGLAGVNTVCLNIQRNVTEDRISCMDIIVEGVDICQTVLCENGGSCIFDLVSFRNFRCVCADGYEGPTCARNVEISTRKGNVCNCVCNSSSGEVFNTKAVNSTMMSPGMASGVTMGTAIATPIGVVLGGGVLTILKRCISKVSPQEVIDEVKDKLPEVPEDEEEDEEEEHEDEGTEERKRRKEEETKWREAFYTSLKRPCTEYQSFEMLGLPDSDLLFV